jgi:transposase
MNATHVSPSTAIATLPPSLPPVLQLMNPACFSFCDQCEHERTIRILRAEKAYWQSMHTRAKAREAQLKEQIEELAAKLRLREQQLFGRKSEQGHGSEKSAAAPGEPGLPPRPRGQQRGKPGHGRRRRKDLPVREERHELPPDERKCPHCGLPYEGFPGSDDSEVVEVEVNAHVRRIKRVRYTRQCNCAGLPAIITAPGPAKLIPKGAYGDSVWVYVLVGKFLLYHPTSRVLASLTLIGLPISQGTITGGMKQLSPLFTPVYDAIIEYNQQASHWHADETRWQVFEQMDGKTGYRWYLWVFKAESSVVYLLDPSRSSQVPKQHLKDAWDAFLSVDRYSAYKAFAKEKNGSIRLVYCWSHVRRDFLAVAKTRPAQQRWALEWVTRIGTLYHLNAKRLAERDNSEASAEWDAQLRRALTGMEEQFTQELADEHVAPVRKKVLISLQNHWPGLRIFVDYADIPMDNNAAERALRGPVVGRKNFYGSGSQWSGQLTAMLFTLFQTLMLWQVNIRTWLGYFFRACAENGGEPLEDVSAFLPWNMSDEELAMYRRPPAMALTEQPPTESPS